jgi:hypothetical protein
MSLKLHDDASTVVRFYSSLCLILVGFVPAFPQRSRPLLFTIAACGSLKPASDRRLRRAYRHLSYSFTLDRRSFLYPSSVCLRHTESRPTELPRRPLAERCVNLSAHTAPIRQTLLPYQPASVRTISAALLQSCQKVSPSSSFGPEDACISSLPMQPVSY